MVKYKSEPIQKYRAKFMDQNINQPKVSVILPVYNGERYLKDAIDSVLNQTFTDFELIVINDGSRDQSLEVAKTFNDPRIKIIDQKNMGFGDALNNGIALAKSAYIAR